MSIRSLTAFVGRVSPFHKGHAEVLQNALCNSVVTLVIIGSADRPRTIKNPWTADERAQMIRSWYDSLPAMINGKHVGQLVIKKQRDYVYSNEKWLASTHEIIQSVFNELMATDLEQDDSIPELGDGKIYITGSDRDASTFYLKELLVTYNDALMQENRDVSKLLSATSIRDIYFGSRINNRRLEDREADDINALFLPQTTLSFLLQFRSTQEYKDLVNEYEFQIEHDRRWSAAPYPPIFQTVDAVVIQTGHILLVKRRGVPGKGLWALPGGYLNVNEWMLDGAVRELYEETKLDVPKAVLYGSFVDDMTFEAPDRSLRGRIITKAHTFKLPDFVVDGKIKMPKVKGSDDAAKARWFPLNEVMNMSSVMFEDHYDIIETMIGRLSKVKK